MYKKNIKQNNYGFTIIETIVALGIFSVSILALVATSTSSLTNLNYARNRVVAGYLSQEGIELVRNIRDSAVALDPINGWANFQSAMTSGGCISTGGCNIDSLLNTENPGTDIGVMPCVGENSCTLYENPSTGYLGINSIGNPTNFKRRIQLFADNSSPNVKGFKIKSSVYWNDGTTSKNIDLIEYIYDWQ